MLSQSKSFVVAKATKVNIISNATNLDCHMTPDDFHLSSFLPYRLAVMSERVSRRLSVEYGRSHGLVVAEWRVLVHLLRCGAVSVRDIHNCVNLEKPRVSRAVSRLEMEGLVQKSQGEGDGRLVAISLTDAGRRALADIIPAATRIEEHLTAAVSAEDLDAFFRVMEHMHSVLDEDPEAKPRPTMDFNRGSEVMP
jgi:DNA-binding MarR family transcriptional regulator